MQVNHVLLNAAYSRIISAGRRIGLDDAVIETAITQIARCTRPGAEIDVVATLIGISRQWGVVRVEVEGRKNGAEARVILRWLLCVSDYGTYAYRSKFGPYKELDRAIEDAQEWAKARRIRILEESC